MIDRLQIEKIEHFLFQNKAIIIYGPRQAGKTTLSEMLLEKNNLSCLHLSGDDFDVRELLQKPNEGALRKLISNNKILFIDEAQRIENIGILIKIVVDRIRNVQIIATGSSSFDLAGQVNEPLTGRKYEVMLLPLSYAELVREHGFLEEKRSLESRLVFGSYPEVITKPFEAEKTIRTLSNSYLYKDIFLMDKMKKPKLLQKLVKALALQVGSEISVNELSRLLGASNKTIEKYIQLLEDTFVIFSLNSFSKNVRNELKKSRKVYFYDNGILNAAKGNFNPIQNREDQGALWENYLISERKKLLNINDIFAESYFWRTTQQQEIDYIEVYKGKITAFEYKWNSKRAPIFSKTFLKAYPTAKTFTINPENYDDYLSAI